MHVAGADGCHGGWLCVEQQGELLRGHLFRSFAQLLEGMESATVITIDIPMGLPEVGERSCDRSARRLLGKPRASSVFPAPIRAVVQERDYERACRIHRALTVVRCRDRPLRFCRRFTK